MLARALHKPGAASDASRALQMQLELYRVFAHRGQKALYVKVGAQRNLCQQHRQVAQCHCGNGERDAARVTCLDDVRLVGEQELDRRQSAWRMAQGFAFENAYFQLHRVHALLQRAGPSGRRPAYSAA